MKFYLSSYKIGNQAEKLKKLVPQNSIGYIANALDHTTDFERLRQHNERDIQALKDLGLEVEQIDLREYFSKSDNLKNKLDKLGAIFVSGGNVFVLRQAMKLSGLDDLLIQMKENKDFLFSGYSAAGCVLSPTLKPYATVDSPNELPYSEQKEIIWEGLGLVDFAFMPHWDSDHPESDDIDKEIEYCKKNNILYKAVRDGEVIIL
jgi:dipeptidase E